MSAAPSYWLLNTVEMADYLRLCAIGEQVESDMQRWVREQDRRMSVQRAVAMISEAEMTSYFGRVG